MGLSRYLNGQSDCPWCGQVTRFDYQQSHIICMACKRSVADCCEGEVSDNGLSADNDDGTRAREPANASESQ